MGLSLEEMEEALEEALEHEEGRLRQRILEEQDKDEEARGTTEEDLEEVGGFRPGTKKRRLGWSERALDGSQEDQVDSSVAFTLHSYAFLSILLYSSVCLGIPC